MNGLYLGLENRCQRGSGKRNYNDRVRHLGAYLIKGKLREEGGIRVYEALDPVTGGTVLLIRPLDGMPPRLDLPRVLPYELPVEDAWRVELPFGVVNASSYRGDADPSRLLAWARRLLATFAELESRGLVHGKLDLRDLWVRGEAVWVSGVGVPWPDPEPDAVRLVAILKQLAGDRWAGWPYAGVLEELAGGQIGYGEALTRLQEPEAVAEVPGSSVSKASEPSPTVRVKGVRKPDGLDGDSSADSDDGTRISPPPEAEEPPEVVRIEEPSDPSFEVVAPPEPTGRRWVLRLALLGLLVVLLFVLGVLFWSRRTPGYVQEVAFIVEPAGARAELVLLAAPEGSRLVRGFRTSVPGSLRFDRAGVYTFEVVSPGYRPKTLALDIPIQGGRVVVRLEGR